MLDKPIAVFAYAFPHRKTYDFLCFMRAEGFTNVHVIAAPRVKLPNAPSQSLVETLPGVFPKVNCVDLCARLGYGYFESPHNDADSIKLYLNRAGCTELAIISGARILPKEVIDIFSMGVVNFHPGKLPETSGLDSFYWMIENGAQAGVTVHYIDRRVDAGELLFFQALALDKSDVPRTVMAKLYVCQLQALQRYLGLIKESWALPSVKIERPGKNEPMVLDEKTSCLNVFDQWLKKQLVFEARVEQAFAACEAGDLVALKDSYQDDLRLYKCNKGRSLLSVAAYFQSTDCIRFLLERGLDINSVNDKGTSVLMYSKTKLMGYPMKDKAGLALLLASGANRDHKDYFGHDVYHYISQGGDVELINYIRRF